MKNSSYLVCSTLWLALAGPVFSSDSNSGPRLSLRDIANDPGAVARIAEETRVLSAEEARDVERGFLAGGEVSVVPSAAFSTDGEAPDSLSFSFNTGLMTGNGPEAGCVKARVYVRNNIDILQFSASVIDDESTQDFFMDLVRIDNVLGGVDTLGRVATSGASSGLQILVDDTIDNSTVDQPTFSYYLVGCLFTNDIALLSARVFYDVSLFDDGFESGDTSAWSTTVP